MKTALITGYDKPYKELADITRPRMLDYADAHHYRFTCYLHPIIPVPNGIYWTGVCGALEHFKLGFDRVVYVDIDQLITNPSITFDNMTSGFHASRDWGNDANDPWSFSMCGFVAHQDCIDLFETALKMEPECRDQPFPEQYPMQYIAMIGTEEYPDKFGDIFHVHPRKVFNAVPEQVSPGNIPDPWKDGDFACHITMAPVGDRIRIASEILNQLV